MDGKSRPKRGSALAVQEVLDRLGGDEELLSEVVDLFIEEVPDILSQLKEALENGDWDRAAKLAHTLKGSSSNVGAEEFASLALKLENDSKQKDSAGAFETYRLLQNELEAVEQFISNPDWIKIGS